ncbi:MAG TPA: hypothetical protein VNN22_24260 [Verrucomicrobiae bacterium]|nr:hypothetical protein [Verrucomicrobiae bacterium]
MKTKIKLLIAATAALAITLVTGCATAVNTKDVTKVTVTQTGIKIGQNPATQVYELMVGRSQVEYVKVPTGLNGTNAQPSDASVIPQFTSSYEMYGHSAVFGNAAMTTTVATGGTNAVNTIIGGQHEPINSATGTGNNLTPVSH